MSEIEVIFREGPSKLRIVNFEDDVCWGVGEGNLCRLDWRAVGADNFGGWVGIREISENLISNRYEKRECGQVELGLVDTLPKFKFRSQCREFSEVLR
jgi:hypothetical protein